MRVLDQVIKTAELKKIANATFGDMVKAVVDVDRELVAIDAELHSDLEALLMEKGSRQNSLWGINLYPEMTDSDFVEFDSMINVRPSQGNRSRGVDSADIRTKIIQVVSKWIEQ